MAFSFGAPAASSTPSFSFGAASTPAFGASTAGLAKTASTPLFGPTTSGFGAASTPGLFGSTSAPSFSLAGAQQAQPSLFGASQPAGTPAASPFGFGGGFGGTPASQPATSFFSQPTQPQQPQQPGMQLASFGFAPATAAAQQVPDESALKELQSIRDSYIPVKGNHRYRFQYLLLNVVENSAARVKPADVDELAWREAMRRAGGPNNADNLWPVLAHGFGDLLQRKAAQDAAIREHTERLEALQQAVAALASRQEAVLREHLEAVKRRHAELCHQLLRILRYIDALEGRFAHAMGYRCSAPRDVLQRLASQLESLEAAVTSGAASGVQAKAEALLAALLRAGGPAPADADALIDPASLEAVFGILSGYAEAVGKMHGVLQRDSRDVAVLQQQPAGER